jgi:signal transduction histidine kinase
MTANFSQIWPFLATTFFIALLSTFTLKQPNRPGKRYFVMIVIVWLIMSLAVVLELVARSGMVRYAAVQIQLLSAMLSAPFLLFFSFEYTGHHSWLSPRRIALFILPVLAIQLLILTNPIHNLVWSEFNYGAGIAQLRQPAGWAGIFFIYLYWLIAVALLVHCMLRAPAFWAPILLILIGAAVPRFAFLFATPGLSGYSPLQLAIQAGNISTLAYFLGIFNFRLLRVLPVAQDVALERMDYSMIVLDAEDRIIAINPAARALPGLDEGHIIGKTAPQGLNTWWQHLSPLIDSDLLLKEVVLDAGQQVFEVHSQPLIHASGWRMGHVFVLSDITPAWRARHQLAQQQWAQATLQERQQIAQELHDGLSQNLAFLNVECQAAQIYLKTGQTEAAQTCLARLVDVLSKMQGDTREMIGDLMIVSSPVEGFIATLRQVLSSFEKQTRIQVDFRLADEAELLCCPDFLDSSMVVQLLRITQEALANVRKHGKKAERVDVGLSVQNEHLWLNISDDGIGFIPAVHTDQDKHFGMRIMRQRAARIGAQFSIRSEIGQGTQIEICIPINRVRKKHEDPTGG